MEVTINKIFIKTAGEKPVGIFPISIKITDWDFKYNTDNKHDMEDLNFIREELRKCFSTILNDEVIVLFDFEFEEMEKQMEAGQ